MSLGPASIDPREGRSSQFTVVFERFKPVMNARGKEVRSERADLELKCAGKATVRIQGALQAYVGHGLTGGSAGPGDPALWTEFAPKGRQPATPTAAVLPLLFGC